jgi:hypothetical protein
MIYRCLAAIGHDFFLSESCFLKKDIESGMLKVATEVEMPPGINLKKEHGTYYVRTND